MADIDNLDPRSRARSGFPKGPTLATVRVRATSEDVRRHVRHPNGTAFRETLAESVAWPNNTFTKRRIRDGSVVLDTTHDAPLTTSKKQKSSETA